jgi:hypothetical protein
VDYSAIYGDSFTCRIEPCLNNLKVFVTQDWEHGVVLLSCGSRFLSWFWLSIATSCTHVWVGVSGHQPVPFGFSVLHGSSAPASMQLSVSCDQQADN